MDAKALAKSKRAHSQQHSKKYHPNQKAKGPAGANEEAVSAKGKQIKDKTKPKPSQKGTSALPSNWDRYDEEAVASAAAAAAAGGLNQASDIVLPKSKGADYGHLIAEAQSHSQLDIHSDTFPSFNHVLPDDWSKGIESMLSVRGEGILSWIGDDNFVVDDKNSAHYEVSFLSLNLHSLAEQLEKIDLPQRLFIEADALPTELQHTGGLLQSTSSQFCDQVQATFVNKGATIVPEESTFSEFSEKIDIADQDINILISGSPGSDSLDQSLTNLLSISPSQVDVDPSQHGKSTNQRKLPESKTKSKVKSSTDVSNKKVATFEAATAEEELDMLLDSFSETKENDFSGFRSGNSFSVQEKASVLMAPNLDDALDDLNETPTAFIPFNQSGPSHSQKNLSVHDFRSSSHSETKSKQLDDIDSWLDTI